MTCSRTFILVTPLDPPPLLPSVKAIVLFSNAKVSHSWTVGPPSALAYLLLSIALN